MTALSSPSADSRFGATPAVAGELFAMSWPLIFGFAAGMLGIVVDSAFLASYGTRPVAIFTSNVPLFSLMTYAAAGCGVAATSVLSFYLGSGDEQRASHVLINALMLGLGMIAALCLLIVLSYPIAAPWLGIGQAHYGISLRFMQLWFVGEFFQAIATIGSGLIKAYGNTRVSALLAGSSLITRAICEVGFRLFGAPDDDTALLVVALVNSISWIMPALIATKMCCGAFAPRQAWQGIPSRALIMRLARVALPMMVNTMWVPVAMALATAIMAREGMVAVAAYGFAMRIETAALIVVQAISYGALPLMGRAIGAQDPARLVALLRVAAGWVLGWGAISAVVFWAFGGLVLGHVSADRDINAYLVTYIYFVPISYGFFGLYHISNSFFLVSGRAYLASFAYAARYGFVFAPFCLIFGHFLGARGVFWGIAAANGVVGLGLFSIVCAQLRGILAKANIANP